MYRLTLALVLTLTAYGQTQVTPQWIPMGPFGGSAAVIQVDASSPGMVVAATNNGLFFRSSDHGDSWKPIAFPPQLRCTLHAFVTAPGAYYAGISSDTPELSGLYRSSDRGVTWQQISGLKKKEVWSLALWKSGGETIAAGTRDGIYLSTDSGITWKHISPADNMELAPVVSLAFDPQNSNSIYAGTPHLPWKTTDGGANWHSIHDGMLDDSDVFSINVDFQNPQRVFASACSGIYRSENAAGLWRKMTGAVGASYRTYIIRQNPANPNLVYAGTTFGLEKSTDAGVTWRKVSSDATRWIAFDPSTPGRLYIATDEGGLQRSDDAGDTFTPINNGFCNRQLPAFTATSDAIVAASIYEPVHGGIYSIKAGQKQWEQVAPASALPAQLLHLESFDRKGQTELFALSYTSIHTSTDFGRKWTPVAGLPRGLKINGFLGSFVATETGLFHSDNARTWTRIEAPIGAQRVQFLAPLGKSGLAAITPSGLFVSEDGAQWKTTAPLPVSSAVVNITAAGDRNMIAGTASGLIHSDDFGASWEPVTWGLGASTVSAVCQHPLHPRTVFAAQYGVVYQSDDGGNNWRPVSPGHHTSPIEIEVIKALAVLPGSPDMLLALTLSQGTFALPLSTSAEVINQSASLPVTNGSGSAQKSNTVR